MDNSYVCINVDISPDIVALLHTAVLVTGLIYLSHRLIKLVKAPIIEQPAAT